MNYKGVIIEESLTDCSILEELKILDKTCEEVTERDGTPWLDKWTLYTVEIDPLNILDVTNRLSKLIDTKHCNDWYCDFKNDEFHYVVFKDKVFKLDRTKKNDYRAMQEYASSLGLPEAQMPSFNDLPINLLIGFLVYAKKQTYAAGGAKMESTRLGSHDYSYEEVIEGEKMIYHDTYFGNVKFMGEEVVYRGGNSPLWGMNYQGITLDDSLSEEVMDSILRPALMKVGEDDTVLPLRGPSSYENGDYLYTFSTTGDMMEFTGVEKIYKNGELIYKLNCHGGLIE